jgi:hypothetical protein
MAEVIPARMTAEIDGDFVVFVIGARFNKLWKLHKWIPVALAMPRMIKELEKSPESGFMGAITGGFTMVHTGGRLNTWRLMHGAMIMLTGRRGLLLISEWRRAGEMWGYGMNFIRFALGSMRPSTPACRRMDLARRASSFRRWGGWNRLGGGLGRVRWKRSQGRWLRRKVEFRDPVWGFMLFHVERTGHGTVRPHASIYQPCVVTVAPAKQSACVNTRVLTFMAFSCPG